MGWETIAIVTGVVLVGLFLVSAIASAERERREEADRQSFYKAVEAARLKEIEGQSQDKNISGLWRGDGTGFFGVGRRLEFKINHSGNTVSGQLKDEYGECMFAGYFVCPYIMFDVRRDDTSFEFRGTLVEASGARRLEGKYRYSTTDSVWAAREVTAGNASIQAVQPQAAKPEPQQVPPGPPGEIEESPVPGLAVEPQEPSPDIVASGSRTANQCPSCHRPMDTSFDFCLYCGKTD